MIWVGLLLSETSELSFLDPLSDIGDRGAGGSKISGNVNSSAPGPDNVLAVSGSAGTNWNFRGFFSRLFLGSCNLESVLVTIIDWSGSLGLWLDGNFVRFGHANKFAINLFLVAHFNNQRAVFVRNVTITSTKAFFVMCIYMQLHAEEGEKTKNVFLNTIKRWRTKNEPQIFWKMPSGGRSENANFKTAFSTEILYMLTRTNVEYAEFLTQTQN
jgi:hypothetical protein